MSIRAHKGFTLIELLVVVAIIGMLSSIILASMASARNKASDSSIKSNLRTTIVQAALYQSTAGSYGPSVSAGECPTSGTSMFYTDANIRRAIAEAKSAGAGATRCATNGTNYAISAKLRSSDNHWCVDSQSAVREISNASWGGVACP